MKKFCFALLLFALGTPSHAKTTCDKNWICIESEVRDDIVYQYARNMKPYPLTVSIYNRTQNLRTGGNREFTRSIKPNGSILITKMPIRNTNRPHQLRYWYDWTVGYRYPQHDDDYLYRLPYSENRRYRVLQGFNSNFSHKGLERYAVDFDMPVGTAVHAAREGTVVKTESRHDRGCWRRGCGRYANYIVVLHDDGTTGEYYHLMKNGVLVEIGDRVARGQKIGYSGNTGHTTTPHLHFAVYKAATWGQTQSIRFRFVGRNGVISWPRRGYRYRVAYE